MKQTGFVLRHQCRLFLQDKGMLLFYIGGIAIFGILFPLLSRNAGSVSLLPFCHPVPAKAVECGIRGRRKRKPDPGIAAVNTSVLSVIHDRQGALFYPVRFLPLSADVWMHAGRF